MNKKWKVSLDRSYRRRKNPELILMDVAKRGPLYPRLRTLVRLKTKQKGRQELNTWEWLAKYAHQTHCPITGLPFNLSNKRVKGAVHPLHPSLDRIEPTKGYTPSNVRVISFWANTSKSTMSDEMFKMMITSAAQNFARH